MRTHISDTRTRPSGVTPDPQQESPLTNWQMQILERQATSPEQFRILSRHYRQQAQALRAQAQEQKFIAEKYREEGAGTTESLYPATSAQNLQHDLERRADEATLKARTCEVKADAFGASKTNSVDHAAEGASQDR